MTLASRLIRMAAVLLAGWMLGRLFGVAVVVAGLTFHRPENRAAQGAALGMIVLSGLGTAFASRGSEINLRYADGRPIASTAALAAGLLLLTSLCPVGFRRFFSDHPQIVDDSSDDL